jgi:hypothetical protein
MLHKESNTVATLSATETFENASCGIHIERRRFFIVEWTQADKVRTSFFQGNKHSDNVFDACRFQYPAYVFAFNHSDKINGFAKLDKKNENERSQMQKQVERSFFFTLYI